MKAKSSVDKSNAAMEIYGLLKDCIVGVQGQRNYRSMNTTRFDFRQADVLRRAFHTESKVLLETCHHQAGKDVDRQFLNVAREDYDVDITKNKKKRKRIM